MQVAGGVFDELLEVVEDNENGSAGAEGAADVVDDRLDRVLLVRVKLERGGQDTAQVVGGACLPRVAKEHLPPPRALGEHADRQAGLSDAGGTDDGDQPGALVEMVADGLEVRAPSHEAVDLNGAQGVAPDRPDALVGPAAPGALRDAGGAGGLPQVSCFRESLCEDRSGSLPPSTAPAASP